jgi:hypothetical protein
MPAPRNVDNHIAVGPRMATGSDFGFYSTLREPETMELRTLNAIIPEIGLSENCLDVRIADRCSIMVFHARVKINFPCDLFYLHSRLSN